jgi:hypothetical protein
MNCLHCRKDLSQTQYVRVSWGAFGSDYFCDRDCLERFLLPDRTPSLAPEPAPKPDLSPQDVVVPDLENDLYHGETVTQIVEVLRTRGYFDPA